MQELGTRAARSKLFIGLAHVAAARCGKGDDCFTLQIIAFQKCIDDRRSNIPPDRESDKDGAVLKAYVGRKDKDLNKLMKYAKLFRVDKIIRNYMEVLL